MGTTKAQDDEVLHGVDLPSKASSDLETSGNEKSFHVQRDLSMYFERTPVASL